MKAHDYMKTNLPGDLAAGVTTAVLLIPQAMAYAMLASLPPQIGLYASTIPPAFYALTGSSRFLAIGPVAIVSLLVASTLAELKAPPESSTGIAVLLALMSGATLALLGSIRGGIIDSFLSHTVIKGFTGGAAIIIALTQRGSVRFPLLFQRYVDYRAGTGPAWSIGEEPGRKEDGDEALSDSEAFFFSGRQASFQEGFGDMEKKRCPVSQTALLYGFRECILKH